MKIASYLLCLVLVSQVYAAPVIFKSEKSVTRTGDYVQIGIFDALNYRQIRIGITCVGPSNSTMRVRIDGLVDQDKLGLALNDYREQVPVSKSYIIDTPPDRISVGVMREGLLSFGTCYLRVWALQ